jgi:putative transposase
MRPLQPLAQSAEMVGLDMGLEEFAVLTNGERVHNPRFFRAEQKPTGASAKKV